MAYQGFDPQSVARVFHTILPNYDRMVHELHLRSRPFQRMMDMMGRISYNRGGNGHQWPVHVRRHELRPYTGNVSRNFEALQPFEHASLPVAGYEVTDAMPERERALAAASGEAKIIDYYANFAKSLETSITQATSRQYFVNGEASGNSNYWKGLGTYNQATQTINSSLTTTTARAKNAADIWYAPSGTYANLNMTLGTYGGAQSTTANWPDSVADPEYDFWSPVIINWASTSLNGTSQSFADQGEEAISLAVSKVLRNESENGGVTHLFLGTSLYEEYKRAMREKQRIIVGAQTPLVNAGFRSDSFSTEEGIEIVREYACHQEEGFGVNFKDFEIRCVLGQMFETQGPFYDEVEDQHRVACRNLSTFMVNSPRNVMILRSTTN